MTENSGNSGSAITELAIIGAGPAGITSAIYAARKNLEVRIFERESVGGMVKDAIVIENYPGFESVKGTELMEKMEEHLRKFGVKIESKGVAGVVKKEDLFEIELEGGEKFDARAVVIATGTEYAKLNIPGEEEFFGRGVTHCATCDGVFFKDKEIAVVGGGNSGCTAAIFLSEICKKVTLVEFLPELRCDSAYIKKLAELKQKNVEIFTNHALEEIVGENKVSGIKIKNRESGEVKEINLQGVFMYVGLKPENTIAKKLDLKLNEHGYIETDPGGETSAKGIFAAGDVTGELAQAVVAAGSGAKAAVSAYDYLRGI